MNWQTRFVLALLLALLCLGCGRSERSEGAPETAIVKKPDWLTDFEKAQAQARAQNKALLINFTGSDWCPPCLMLEREVFKQPEFTEYAAKNLVLLMVDFPRIKMQSLEERAANRKLAERYEIDGFPTIVLLDLSGKKIGELGYMAGGPKPFIAAIEQLSEADAPSTP
jgi:protein disulfide-isomerase